MSLKTLVSARRYFHFGCLLFILLLIPFADPFFQSHEVIAQADDVEIYFVPDSVVMPPSLELNLMLDTKAYEVGFVKIELNFDHEILRLTNEIKSSEQFSTIIIKTTKAEANSTGHIVLVMALSPTDTAPSGVLEIAQLSIESITENLDQLTTLSVYDEGVEIVAMTATELSFISEPADIVINPTSQNLIYLPIIE